MASKKYPRYFMFISLVLMIYLTFLLMKPYLMPITSSVILAFLFYPLYKRLHKKVKRENLAALLMVLFVLIILFVPLTFLVSQFVTEIGHTYTEVNTYLDENGVTLDTLSSQIYESLGVEVDLASMARNFFTSMIEYGKQFLKTIPKKIVSVFITIFLMFFWFRDGKKVLHRIGRFVPFKASHQKHIFKQFKDTIQAVVYGQIIIAIVQGLVAALGYFIFGLTSPLFWGGVTILAALIPFLGSAVIWVPASVYLFLMGVAGSSPGFVARGIGLFLYGLLLVSTIDNVLKPRFISSKTRIHTALVLIGIVGGIAVFGLIGIILGPLIMAMFLAIIKIVEEEKLLS